MTQSPFEATPADGRPEASGRYALDTLEDDETIARLATGIKRFKLPDEFNPIKIYQTIADDPKTGRGRRGAERAWRRSSRTAASSTGRSSTSNEAGCSTATAMTAGSKSRLDQILKPWGQFEPLMTQPAGRGATVDFRFRNGRRVQFEAHEVLFDKLLKDVKDYIASSPKQIDWQESDISDIGARLVARESATISGSLRRPVGPRPGAAGRPSRQADHRHHAASEGRRLLAHRDDGGGQYEPDRGLARRHRHHQEAAGRQDLLLRRRCADRLARPAGRRRAVRLAHGAGGRQERVPRRDQDARRSRPTTRARCRSRLAGFNGQQRFFQWLATARTTEGRSLTSVSRTSGLFPINEPTYDQVKVYAITDRPVYRPGTPVRFKFWVARARYDQQEESEFAGKPFTVEIRNPKGDKVFTKAIHGRRIRRLRRLVRAAVGRDAGRLSGLHAQAAAAARSGSKSTRSPSSR